MFLYVQFRKITMCKTIQAIKANIFMFIFLKNAITFNYNDDINASEIEHHTKDIN